MNLFKINQKNITSDIAEVENKLGFGFPPLYKEFIKTFEIGEKAILKNEYLTNGNLGYCSSYEYSPNTAFNFEYFMTLTQSFDYWNDVEDSDVQKQKLLYPIGVNGSYDGINVGVGGNNADQVFWVNEDEVILIAKSIFEFIKGIKIWTVEQDENLKGSIPFDKLYKNWGEDFWRVRG
jgi:hypothetical protein